MKDAAKCDKRCEWQNPANQENAERILRFQVIPESIFGSGHLYYNAVSMSLFENMVACVVVGQRRFSVGALNLTRDMTWVSTWYLVF